MARISNDVKALGEKNRATMSKCPSFKVWVKRHLKNQARIEEYEKAFNFIQKGSDDEQDII